jgi:hypothetical protein
LYLLVSEIFKAVNVVQDLKGPVPVGEKTKSRVGEK